MKTIFCDIDGVLLYHHEDFSIFNSSVLPSVKEKLLQWHVAGYTIILVTGRTEAMRKVTEEHLVRENLFFDQLVMGVGAGPRILINDIDPKYPGTPKAISINLTRNAGLTTVNIDDKQKEN